MGGALLKGTLALDSWSFEVSSLHMGLSENVVYPKKTNGFADHYPY